MPHRSPITFWLLLTATLCVDAVVLKLAAGESYPSPSYSSVAIHALILGELSVVCIWSSLNQSLTTWTQIAPLLAVALAAFVEGARNRAPGHIADLTTFTASLGYFGLHAALLLVALWLLQRTAFWRHRTGIARTWQFSNLHLLVAMTVVAVLTVLIRNSEFFFKDDALENITYGCTFVALAVASVVLWTYSCYWFLRLASVVGVGMLLGIAIFVIYFYGHTGGRTFDVFNVLHVHYQIQAIVLSVWLGIGPVLPPRADAVAVENDAPLAST